MEPSPTDDEVRLEQVPTGSGHVVLRIRAEPRDARRPYAQLRQGGRFFVARIGDRIRPMTREEIFSLASEKRKEKETRSSEALKKIQADLGKRQKAGAEGLWVHVEPVPPLEIDLEAEAIEELLRDPEKTGNRRMGWNFAVTEERPVHRKGRFVQGHEEYARIEVHETGALVFTASFDALRHGARDRTIYPYALMEYPTSVLRLATVLYRAHQARIGEVLVDMAILGCGGWTLVPHSPKAIGHRAGRGAAPFDEAKDLVWDRPLFFKPEDLMESPDRCAYRLVLRAYHAFGYDSGQVPHEFDPNSGRLLLPS